ncbi:MAG: anthranilate phosphoribosyltransferase [Pseudomonadota bacterium]
MEQQNHFQILKPFLSMLAEQKKISYQDAFKAFEAIMSGDASNAQIGAFLMGLRQNGETIDVISAAVSVMRQKMQVVKAPDDAIDIVGTGGDGAKTLNISTSTAFVVAGCGVHVAKHGNRAFSSLSGAADILQALGVNLDAELAVIERAIRTAKIAFLMAPKYHTAMRFVGPARAELGFRTLFNILGPMSNPANVRRLLVGCYSPHYLEPMAQTLARLGCKRCWMIHGHQNFASQKDQTGFDEISICGPTKVVEWHNDKLDHFEITPQDADCKVSPSEDIKGGDSAYNAKRLIQLLKNQDQSGYYEMVVLNSAAAFVIAGAAKSLVEGAQMARRSIAEGHALNALNHLIKITNQST